ncbi:MAG: SUMF1/EgtB/PvdO family nonheme iron enzyme, partial [Anaerolineales bacterium]|nr:SUMF1/EgtB/PvdO family nonheme iron enzyme [Anaerolineales bacterium]
DVKPANILLAADKRIVLTDFGLVLDAGLGGTGDGTPQYMAPEQVRQGVPIVPQTDIYALGVVLFEMLSGHLPFDDPSGSAVALQQVTLPPPSPCQFRPELSTEVEHVLLRALAKNPAERYENGRSLLTDLAEALSAQSNDLLGQQLDEYQLEALLGQGGMARIYRGYDARLQRHAAIKVIDMSHRSSEAYRARFQQEAQAIARLEHPESHPNIVRLYRYGEASGVFYIAMQYIEGENLRQRLDRYQQQGKLMPPQELLHIVRQVCDALDFAHSKGIVHRDVKPANIMINAAERVFLTDFGLVLPDPKQTRGEVFGSPRYIAPEQAISSASAVPQSDLYAVGVILYEAVTGRLPFAAADPLDTAMMHMGEQPPPPQQFRPDLSPEVAAIILRCLAKDPAHRYASGRALSDALASAFGLEKSPTISQPQSLTEEREPQAQKLPPAIRADAMQGLPPIPAAVVLAEAETAVPTPPPNINPPRKRRGCMVGVVGLLLLALIPVALWFTAWEQGRRVPTEVAALIPAAWGMLPTSTTMPTPTDLPVETAVTTPPVITPATAVATAATTASPTATMPPTATASPTQIASPTMTTMPTATPSPTSTPTRSATLTPSPTASATPLPTPIPVITLTRAQDNMSMVLIPATTFIMGAADGDEAAEADERPSHSVTLDSFYIDQHEVTVAQYAAFLNELGGYVNACNGYTCLSTQFETTNSYLTDNGTSYIAQPGFADYPINNVSWYGAQAYCTWVGGRLPTEAEWELAASGGNGSIFPWGDAEPDETRAVFGGTFTNLQTVTMPTNGYTDNGITGLAGNVWEWVADSYDETYYATSPSTNPTGPAVGTLAPHVLRGGGYDSNIAELRTTNRENALPNEFRGIPNVGFRCAQTGE